MNAIATLDLISIIASSMGLIIVIARWKKVAAWEIKLLIMSIFLLSVLYSIALFIEWFANIIAFDPYEDFIGAMIPMMWGFFFYSFIQQASSADLRESKKQLDLALRGTRAGLWDLEVRSGKAKLNERWAEIIGYSLKELEPLSIETWRKHTHPEDLIKSELLLQKHFEGKTDFYECGIRMKHKKGHWVWIMNRGMITERDQDGKPLRMTGTHIDITRQKQVESELKKQIKENRAVNQKYMSQNKKLKQSIVQIQKINQELIKSKEKAEESDRLKSAFITNMSHEIRTPMNGIIGFSSMMAKSDLSIEKKRLYTKIIIDSSNQLLTIVNDILDISRIETGKLEIVEKEVNLNNLIDNLYAFFKPQADNKGISLITSKDKDENSIIIKTDPVRLRQVLSNLLHNAVKFTEKGHIKFGYRKIKKELQFFVKDTGIGIAENMHKVIFKPFRQVELEMTRVPGGTGLGLSISKKLIELLGGRIWLESEPGMGSTFYFTIPRQSISKPAIEPVIESGKTAFKPENLIILVAEDDEVNFLYLKEVLENPAIQIIRVQNGLEAIELCKSGSEIHMVLMDIKMPMVNGYDATKQIKKMRPALPVIAITALAKEKDQKEALDAGCDAYLSKPVKKEELLACIEKFCQGTNV